MLMRLPHLDSTIKWEDCLATMNTSALFLRRLVLLGVLFSLLSLGGCKNAGAAVGKSENADLVFGGTGTGQGQFTIVRDIAFDKQNNLYVLESNGQIRTSKTDMASGQARVQKFDDSGRFLLEFPLGADIPEPIRGGGPTRLAIDSRGIIAVTLPQQDLLRLFDARGQKLRDVPLPGAQAVTVTGTGAGERFAVVAWKTERKNRQNVTIGGDAIQLVDAASGATRALPLSNRVENATDITATPDGSLWLLGTSQIWGFDANGRKIRVLGSGLRLRAQDGSEPQTSLTSDSQGNLYAPIGGNPVLIGRYSADGKTITSQHGQFKFADPWANGTALPLAIDRNDRLWLASTSYHNDQNAPRYHPSPSIIRTVATFYKTGVAGVKTSDARVLGLSASVQTSAPYNILYNLAPTKCEFVVAPSNRNVQNLNVRWHIYDWRQNAVGEGQFALPLQDGAEARAPMVWTPPRYGWYTARAQIFEGTDPLTAVVAHFGVTPRFGNMVSLKEGDSPGGWEDALRQLFSGLPMMRLHVPGRTDPATLDKWMASFAKSKALEPQGLNIIVQLTDNKANFNPDTLRPALERLKGQVKYIELFNEPNFSYSPAAYVAAAKPIYALVKDVDPTFRVLGPAVCGISLPWHEDFFKAGGAQTYDEFACHDYEGNESITPEHWIWKFAQLHAMMKRYGVDNRPMWQTERALTGVRVGSFLPAAQAVRVSLHVDLLQTLGIPPERNLHYYLNKGGYTKVPSYLWTNTEGPFPGALALRTRYSLTKGLTYADTLDFGVTGNQLFMGLRYTNANGADALVSLRNMGDFDQNAEFTVTGSPQLALTDSWGNTSTVTARGGKITLPIGQLPTFVRLAPGQKLQVIPMNLGRNIAPDAHIELVAGQSDRAVATLTNSIIESEHGDSPTRGQSWNGGPLEPGKPDILELHWPAPHAISSVLLRGPRADNASCALLDFDLQAWQNGAWKTIVQSRTPLPESYEGQMGDANSVQWYLDDNLRLSRFAPIQTDRLRIVALRSTYGYNGDAAGLALNRAYRNSPPPSYFGLKEVEVFGP
ncbi:hypothetical protein IAD21_06268 [Abditibacteriota bacterium]|nr:hypothetical protein IAD21_06268 [Abditibacteriota bacterium]